MNLFTFTKLGRAVVLSAVLAVGAASGESALDLSVGGGNFFGGNFGGGITGKATGTSISRTWDENMPEVGGGIYYFFDLTYAEISVGVFGGGGQWTGEWKSVTLSSGTSTTREIDDGALVRVDVDLGLLLKYPVPLSETMIVFPAAGIDYQMCVLGNLEDDEMTKDLSRFWIKFGAVADFFFSERIFVQPVLLYGIGLENKIDKVFQDAVSRQLSSGLSGAGTPDVSSKLSHGLTVKIGVGFKL